MMQAQNVIHIITWLEAAGISVWLDGGWGIDALVGEQTRLHNDLDVVISLHQAQDAREALRQHEFILVKDELPTRFVLCDEVDRRIDFHTVTFDADGGCIQQLQDGTSFRYPPEGFYGRGKIMNQTLRCLTAEVQMLCHVGYTPDANDYHDVHLLHTRFGLDLPPPYQR